MSQKEYFDGFGFWWIDRLRRKKNSDYLFDCFCQLCYIHCTMVQRMNYGPFSLKKDELLVFDTEFLCSILKKFNHKVYICSKLKR